MVLDDLLTGFGETLEQESALLDLADAWVERTNGEVVPGVVWGRNEYIRNLQQTALWQNGGIDVKEVIDSVKLISGFCKSKEEYFVLYFPRFSLTLDSFLANSDEIKYPPNSSPTSLVNVLYGYRIHGSERSIVRGNGDCSAIYSHILSGKYSEDFLLSSINPELRKRWEEYRASRKLPPSVLGLVEETLEHFLNNSDEIKYAPSSSPKSLATVLLNYNSGDGEGSMTRGRGNCNKVYHHLNIGSYSKDFLLYSINSGLRKRWDEFQASRKLPTSAIEIVEGTLEHFLNDSDDVKYSSRHGPRSLMTVLRRYKTPYDGVGGSITRNNVGNCVAVHTHIDQRNYSEEFLLSSIKSDLRKRWEEYQKTKK